MYQKYLCVFLRKCTVWCPMLNKIWKRNEILHKNLLLPVRMKQHSQPSMDYCELLYWCFGWNLSHHFWYHSDWTNLVTNSTKDIRGFLSHFRSWSFDYEEYIIRSKIGREEWITLMSRTYLSTFPFLGKYTKWTLQVAFRNCIHHN